MGFKASALADLKLGKLVKGMFYSDADNRPYCFSGRIEGDKYYFRRTDKEEGESRVEGFVRESELHMLKPAPVRLVGKRAILTISEFAHKPYDLVPDFVMA